MVQEHLEMPFVIGELVDREQLTQLDCYQDDTHDMVEAIQAMVLKAGP